MTKLKRTPPPSPQPTRSAASVNENSGPSKTVLGTDVSDLQHCSSAPDLHSLAANITERKKRKHEGDNDLIAMLGQMFSDFSKKQESRLMELQSTVNKINEQNTDLQKSVDMMSHKYDEFLSRITSLENERIQDKKVIKDLEERLEALQRKSHASGIEIRNLPKIIGENKESLSNSIMKLGNIINVNIESTCINDIYRLKSKNTTGPVIVSFTTTLKKENIIKGIKRFNDSRGRGEKLNTHHLDSTLPPKPIYVSEALTHNAQKLYYLARNFQRNHGYAFCWTLNGIVYLRKDENSPHIRILTEADLEKLKNKD